jgi:hypothetical protein
MYHLDRCGIKEEVRVVGVSVDECLPVLQEKPWKCYRCGLIATVNDSKEHLRTCGRPAVDETPSMDNEEVCFFLDQFFLSRMSMIRGIESGCLSNVPCRL